jgi:cytochrome P450
MTNKNPPGPVKLGERYRNFKMFRQDLLGYLTQLRNDYGDVVRFGFGPFTMYFVARPDFLREIFVEHASKFYKTRLTKRILSPSLGNGLLISDGDYWKKQRRLMQPAFHHKRIESYANVMVNYTQNTLRDWRDGQARAIDDDMMALTLAIVSKCLFDTDVTNEESDELREAIGYGIRATNEEFNSLFIPPAWLPTERNRKGKETIATVHRVLDRFIREHRASGEDRGDLLSMMMLATDEDGKSRMSDKEVRDESFTLISAGHETTAVALGWAWYLLSQHPNVEKKLHDELDRVLGGRTPTMADLQNLTYVDWVVNETMRLYPPAYITSREALQDIEVGGYVIAKGNDILLSPYIVHHDARFFSQPESFIPERWQGDFEKSLPKCAYMPFGAGPRVCIGNMFAAMEVKLILATVAQHYRLELAPGAKVEKEPLITLRPKYGMPMIARARKKTESKRISFEAQVA